ncbi:two-component system sensor histidine kinase NtrB [Jiella mangrovi]|nr:PAS domain S-box protein [Jiella mangrovi]
MTAVVVTATLLAGFLIHLRTGNAALPLALKNFEASTGLTAGYLETYVATSEEDVEALTRLPSVMELASLQGGGRQQEAEALKTAIAGQFAALLEAKPRYDQIRLIGKADRGLELVRVDRRSAENGPTRVSEANLQSKAAQPYFDKALSLDSNGVYVSPLNYNRENGEIENPPVPTIRMAKPVFVGGGPPKMFVIVNIDMRPALSRLQRPDNLIGAISLLDEQGNYLVNPKDAERVFGFETGEDYDILADRPALSAVLATADSSVFVFDEAGVETAAAVWPVTLAGSRRLTVIQTAPTSALLADTRLAFSKAILTAGLLAALVAVMVAVVIARGLVRPIQALTRAVENRSGERAVPLATHASGEVGALARAIARYMEREALLSAIVGSSFDAIVTKDLEGVITSWNEAAVQLYGYTPEEAIGQKLELIVPEDRRFELSRIMDQLRSGNRIGHFQTVRMDKAGNRLDVSLTISPVRNAAGEIVGASAITRDITRALADARNLQKLQSEAAHTARVTAAGQMAATLAHELNQPLTAIINYIRSIQRLQQDSGVLKEARSATYAQKAVEQANRASEIVRRVRNFIGNRQTNVTRANINDVIDEGLSLILLGRKGDGIALERDYGVGLPQVLVDPVHVQQIVANLAQNAIEAMALSQNRMLTVTTRQADDAVVVSFADSGGGVDDAILENLFEPFTTTKPAGMGFGLNICRSLVEAQGGTLRVRSSSVGAIFEFLLPVADAPVFAEKL